MNLFTAPPVFIVVCNNTTVSKEVFKYMAGYESVDADGNTIYIDGQFPIFSNYRNGLPVSRQPSLLIDSIAIDEAGQIVDDDFKRCLPKKSVCSNVNMRSCMEQAVPTISPTEIFCVRW